MGWESLDKLRKVRSFVKYDDNEIPVMISQSGKLVCIQIKKDMPTIGIVGAKRTGKSIRLNAFVDTIYHKRKKDSLIVLNDSADETITWSMKCDSTVNGKKYGEKFKQQLQAIGLKPMRLPVVHCYPALAERRLISIPENISSLKVSLDKEKIIESEELFGQMGKSLTYFRTIKESLMKAKSYDDMFQIIDDNIPNKQVNVKLKGIMDYMFQEKIISFDDDVVSDAFFFNRITGERREMHIFMALMVIRCIPVFMTSDISRSKYYPNYLKTVLEDLFYNQKSGYFKENQINTWVFIDEMGSIDSMKRNRVSEMSIMLQRLVTEGGPSRIGTVWANQIYSEVRDGIRKNTKYLFVFRMNTTAEVNMIMNDFGLTQSQANSIKKLRKENFECLAVTTDDNFVLYDLNTGEKSYYSGVIRGYSIPPMSLHKEPEFVFPKTNLQYAKLYMKEKSLRVGNKKKNTVAIDDFIGKVDMEYEELEETKFPVGEFDIGLFAPPEIEIVEITYDELKSYGFRIYSSTVNPYIKTFKQQRVIYGLLRVTSETNPNMRIMPYCPKDVVIEFNPVNNRIRLRSPNILGGATSWKRIYD